jgi:hypothetical protein
MHSLNLAPRCTASLSKQEVIEKDHERRKPFLVVTALGPVLRGQPGRNPGDKDDTTRHLSGRSVRVLAFGLAIRFSASRIATRKRAAGNALGVPCNYGDANRRLTKGAEMGNSP